MEQASKLFDAAAGNDVDAINKLYGLGTVDLDVGTEEKYAEDFRDAGTSALWIACWYGSAQAVDVLAELGADVGKCDKGGRSPLYAAASKGKSDVVRMLVEKHGEDANQARAETGASIVWFPWTF